MKKYKKIISKIPSIGFLAFASFVICAISGIVLTTGYDVTKPYLSISEILFNNPLGSFFRSVHYWSAQFTLILFILHVIDHFIRKSEYDIKRGVWMRLTIVIPFVFYLMFSGFLLRADSDAIQARNIAGNLLNSIPLIGNYLKKIFFGNAENLTVVFIHHVSTVTLIVWLSTIEHAKKILPGAKYILYTIISILIFSFLFVPELSLVDSNVIKGPWYFVGVQEILHWLSYPIWVILIFVIVLASIYYLPNFRKSLNRKIKYILFGLLALYFIFIIIAQYFRYENWELDFLWNKMQRDNFTGYNSYFIDSIKTTSKKINGRIEGCLNCHGMTGFTKSHDISILGCSGCHLGNPMTLNKKSAHEGMIRIPGNMNDASRTCGKNGCHPEQVARVEKSLMNTMSGVVAVDRWVFDENNDLNNKFNIQKLNNTPADRHLKNLCASCHLSKEKKLYGQINELSRGGGCNACHLKYNDSSLKDLIKYKKSKKFRNNHIYSHPQLTIKSDNRHCFGCHSRSGRISLSYEGWHETKFDKMPDKKHYKKLMDGRILEKHLPDIHFERGMICIDCHLSYEVMGDGKSYSHKEEQVKIVCEDCHSNHTPKLKHYDEIDYETQRIIDILGLYDINRKFLVSKSGLVYSNVFFENGKLVLKTKNKDTLLEPKPIINKCGMDIAGHKRLSCKSCHEQWSPQCIGCHTQFERNEYGFNNLNDRVERGAWIEYDGIFLPEPPVLGVNTERDKIETYIPGMILTIQEGNSKKFKRLYSAAFSHTIRKVARNCKSCHFNANSIGFGRGESSVDKKNKKIYFTQKYKNIIYDNLPEDAWTGFLKNPLTNSSTRKNNRAFNVTEQKKILNIGFCFICHSEDNRNFIKVFYKSDWKKKITVKCILLFN